VVLLNGAESPTRSFGDDSTGFGLAHGLPARDLPIQQQMLNQTADLDRTKFATWMIDDKFPQDRDEVWLPRRRWDQVWIVEQVLGNLP
jgi:hypothetical protein